MTFPTTLTPAEALPEIKKVASRIKVQVQVQRNASAAAPTNRASYINLMRLLQNAVDQWDIFTAAAGLSQYAKDQFSDQALDVASEYVAMRSSAITLRDWIFDNLPKTGSSPLLVNLNTDGTLTDLTVSVAATAGFRTEADAFIATIG